jgi:hypothetical protein
MLTFVANFASLIAAAAAVAHVAFAMGAGATTRASTIPTSSTGQPLFDPGPLVTLAVAFLLGTFAGIVAVTAWSQDEPGVVRVMVWAAVAVLTARAVGDFRHVGLTKRVRGTPFARRDDRVFTPIVLILILGGLASLAA